MYPCDDGNVINWDGCTRLCQLENGWTCNGGTHINPDTCIEITGDCWRVGRETCDDGNLINGDGCNNLTPQTLEAGWYCLGGNRYNQTCDVCYEICGDGKHMGQYPCDDGNTNSYDGCSSLC